MPRIGWHASHEQIPPSRLLRDARHAEEAGFRVGMSSDHFSPWSARQNESGFAWSWLGAALATTGLPFRVVNAPGQRYHPAIVAQAIATLAEMFPDRLWVCLGTGEASNEHITGDRWPPKPVRNARLAECVAIIRALLAGEEVSHDGLVRVDRARLWTLPAVPPPLLGAAVTEETARVGRRLGRRPRDDPPAARPAATGDRRLSRGRGRGQADGAPGCTSPGRRPMRRPC